MQPLFFLLFLTHLQAAPSLHADGATTEPSLCDLDIYLPHAYTVLSSSEPIAQSLQIVRAFSSMLASNTKRGLQYIQPQSIAPDQILERKSSLLTLLSQHRIPCDVHDDHVLAMGCVTIRAPYTVASCSMGSINNTVALERVQTLVASMQ
jgi:hypothetical protein